MTGLTEQTIELLRELMELEGLSANALAARCGVSQEGISRILAGTRQPKVETIERILAGLGFDGRIEIEPK